MDTNMKIGLAIIALLAVAYYMGYFSSKTITVSKLTADEYPGYTFYVGTNGTLTGLLVDPPAGITLNSTTFTKDNSFIKVYQSKLSFTADARTASKFNVNIGTSLLSFISSFGFEPSFILPNNGTPTAFVKTNIKDVSTDPKASLLVSKLK